MSLRCWRETPSGLPNSARLISSPSRIAQMNSPNVSGPPVTDSTARIALLLLTFAIRNSLTSVVVLVDFDDHDELHIIAFDDVEAPPAAAEPERALTLAVAAERLVVITANLAHFLKALVFDRVHPCLEFGSHLLGQLHETPFDRASQLHSVDHVLHCTLVRGTV